MDVASDKLERSITIPAEGTTRIWGVNITGITPDPPNPFFVTVPGGLPEGVTLDLGTPSYTVDNQGVPMEIPELDLDVGGDGAKPKAKIGFGYAHCGGQTGHLYFILTNTGTSEQTVTIQISRPVVTWIPADPVGKQGEKIPVQLVVEQIPEGIENLEVDWLDPVVVPVSNGRAETAMFVVNHFTIGNFKWPVLISIPFTSAEQWPPNWGVAGVQIPFTVT